tara:strand:+ start:1685 stop:2119 length:435 start_codon:yes stop_codon:yes gene_type:complete
MGFDIYGLSPKYKDKPTIDWTTATDKDKDAYFKAMNKFEEENPGYYFRNNVWWWRPLGELIHDKCGDLLTEQQRISLQYNDGTTYTKKQAIRIAERLSECVKNGYVAELEKSIKSIKDNSYPFCKKNVEEFIEFAKHSGGFQIC